MATIVKMKIKSARMTTELTGGIPDALDALLVACDNRQEREKALASLAECHKRVCDWEAQRDLEALVPHNG